MRPTGTKDAWATGIAPPPLLPAHQRSHPPSPCLVAWWGANCNDSAYRRTSHISPRPGAHISPPRRRRRAYQRPQGREPSCAKAQASTALSSCASRPFSTTGARRKHAACTVYRVGTRGGGAPSSAGGRCPGRGRRRCRCGVVSRHGVGHDCVERRPPGRTEDRAAMPLRSHVAFRAAPLGLSAEQEVESIPRVNAGRTGG